MTFPVGSELIALDTEVIISHEQKGYFPLLEHLIPKEEGLHVIMTRDFKVAEKWVDEREAEGIDYIGYMVHTKEKIKWETTAAFYTGNLIIYNKTI